MAVRNGVVTAGNGRVSVGDGVVSVGNGVVTADNCVAFVGNRGDAVGNGVVTAGNGVVCAGNDLAGVCDGALFLVALSTDMGASVEVGPSPPSRRKLPSKQGGVGGVLISCIPVTRKTRQGGRFQRCGKSIL